MADKEEKTEVTEAELAMGIAVIALSPFVFILNAYTASTMWAWFAVPQFGVAPVGIAMAGGLLLLFKFVMPKLRSRTKKERDEITSRDSFIELVHSVFTCIFILAGGWCFKQYI